MSKQFPPQHQDKQPGERSRMNPKPQTDDPEYRASDKLKEKVALITGGDSGIGRAVAIAFAKEGANLTLVYLDEHEDAEDTRRIVERHGGKCLLIAGDIGDEDFCQTCVQETIDAYGRLNILVNNAAEQHPSQDLEGVTAAQVERTFRTNVFSMFHFARAVDKHLQEGDCIINTTSVTAYRGSPHLIDYAATKGAIVAFTRSLSGTLSDRKIRVNAVAPGPIWTPLIPATFDDEKVESFGGDQPLGRAGQPCEVAPCYVFLASRDASYMSGQVLHPNGGEIVNT